MNKEKTIVSLFRQRTQGKSILLKLWSEYLKKQRNRMILPKVKLVWQTPDLYKYAGLYFIVGSKRYRIFKVGYY